MSWNFMVKPKTFAILAALFVILCAGWSLAQTPKTRPPQKAAPTPQKTLLAPVKIGDKWGYIDQTGKMVVQPQFDLANPFAEELAAVQVGWRCGFPTRIQTHIREQRYYSRRGDNRRVEMQTNNSRQVTLRAGRLERKR